MVFPLRLGYGALRMIYSRYEILLSRKWPVPPCDNTRAGRVYTDKHYSCYEATVGWTASIITWKHLLVHDHFRNAIKPLLVIWKDDGVDVKAELVLPHMDASLDHHAHSSSYETQLCESVSLFSLWACQQPTGRAETHCSPGHSLRIACPSASPSVAWRGLFISPLSAWLSEESPRLQQGQLEKLPMLFSSLRARPLVWSYHIPSPLFSTHMQ